jgi:transcriptional regulator with XRE-family HTH domain
MVGTNADQVSRWELGERGMSFAVMSALADALKIEPADFFSSPETPSLDGLLSGASNEQIAMAADIVRRIVGR